MTAGSHRNYVRGNPPDPVRLFSYCPRYGHCIKGRIGDLKAVLNNEDKDDARNAPLQQGKRPPPPPLTTSRSASQYAPSPHSTTFDSPQRYTNPPIALSPASYPPPSAQSYTSTPYSAGPPQNYQSPYQRSAPLPSPGPRSGSLSSSHFPPGQRPPSHHSLHRSSTSPLDPIPSFSGSPQLNRNVTPSSAYPPQPLPPHTPLGPPPPITRHDSTHSSHLHYDSPAPPPYRRHRSSSGASYTSPSAPHALPPPRSGPHPQDLTLRRESTQSHPSQRTREDSVSVSPRTVMPTIARQSSQADPDPLRRGSVAMDRPSLDGHTGHSAEAVRHHSVSYAQMPQFFDGPAPEAHGLKRPAEGVPSGQAYKKPKVSSAPPIWALPKKTLPPMKVVDRLRPNGATARQSRSPLPPINNQPQGPRPQVSYNSIHDESYERSFRDIVPAEDMSTQVADFIFANVVTTDPGLPLEIEAKVGRIIPKGSRERFLPAECRSEAIIAEQLDVAFESRMTEANHKGMNNFLNESLLLSKQPNPKTGKQRIPMDYVHHREADAFYELPPQEVSNLEPLVRNYASLRSRGSPRVRITRNLQTGEVLAKVIKIRLSDKNVSCPNWAFDWRISISVEFPWSGDVDMLEEYAATKGRREPSRNKDRLSYQHQFCRIDLTQVKIGVQPGGHYDHISHELEVEMDVQTARTEGQKVLRGEPNHYPEYIKVFIDNVRTLAKTMRGG